jgi:hypothetical protein
MQLSGGDADLAEEILGLANADKGHVWALSMKPEHSFHAPGWLDSERLVSAKK